MFEAFKKYILEKTSLTDEELALIEAASVPKKLRKKQYLLQEGDVSRHNSFIVKGCLRLYRLGTDGNEHILRFAIENWWISDRESYSTGLPTKYYIDALEDSELLTWTKQNWEALEKKIPAFAEFRERLLARSFIANQNRINNHISLTAEEKYQHFMQDYPDFYNRVPLHMIASFLGVSRETLSRIRSQYAHK